mgnify:FL=1
MMKTCNICTICNSATLIHRQNLRTLVVIAGVLDVLLRTHVEHQQDVPTNHAPWEQLGKLVALLAEPTPLLEAGATQGTALADNVAKHWLGTFDSLCLNCGFLLMDEPDDPAPG